MARKKMMDKSDYSVDEILAMSGSKPANKTPFELDAAELQKHTAQLASAKETLQRTLATMAYHEALLLKGELGRESAYEYLELKRRAAQARKDILRHLSNLRSCAFAGTDLTW